MHNLFELRANENLLEIIEKIKESKLSYAELARLVGSSRTNISLILNGNTKRPSYVMLISLLLAAQGMPVNGLESD